MTAYRTPMGKRWSGPGSRRAGRKRPQMGAVRADLPRPGGTELQTECRGGSARRARGSARSRCLSRCSGASVSRRSPIRALRTCTYVGLRHGVPATCVLIPVMHRHLPFQRSKCRYMFGCWRDLRRGCAGCQRGERERLQEGAGDRTRARRLWDGLGHAVPRTCATACSGEPWTTPAGPHAS
jgi:hypothetical protein